MFKDLCKHQVRVLSFVENPDKVIKPLDGIIYTDDMGNVIEEYPPVAVYRYWKDLSEEERDECREKYTFRYLKDCRPECGD